MLSHKKLQEIIHETYCMLYKAATPSVDFDELVNRCSRYLDENGQVQEMDKPISTEEAIRRGWKKDIQFEKYYLDKDSYKEIVDNQIKKYKIKKGLEQNTFAMHAYLGCGPTSKKSLNKTSDGKE